MNKDDVVICDLTVRAGSEYVVDIDYTDDDEVSIDMTGWTVESQIREFVESIHAISFETSADETGIHMSLDKETTKQLRFARGVYDVFITDTMGTRTKLMEGHVDVIGGVTR